MSRDFNDSFDLHSLCNHDKVVRVIHEALCLGNKEFPIIVIEEIMNGKNIHSPIVCSKIIGSFNKYTYAFVLSIERYKNYLTQLGYVNIEDIEFIDNEKTAIKNLSLNNIVAGVSPFHSMYTCHPMKHWSEFPKSIINLFLDSPNIFCGYSYLINNCKSYDSFLEKYLKTKPMEGLLLCELLSPSETILGNLTTKDTFEQFLKCCSKDEEHYVNSRKQILEGLNEKK
jgi:hypothetical protein